MTLTRARSFAQDDALQDVLPDEAVVSEAPARAKPALPLKRPRAVVLIPLLSALLAIEWLAIGLVFWTTQAGGALPGQIVQSRERMFRVTLAAEHFWRTGDAIQAEKDLAAIPRADLTQAMTTLLRETTDPITRLHLTALAQALRVNTTESPLFSFLFSQGPVVFGILISIVPLLAAIGLFVFPLVFKREQSPDEQIHGGPNLERALEELIVEAPIEEIPAPEPEANKEQSEASASEEDSGETDAGLGDLASLFEEEDTSISALEQFCKGLLEISVDDVVSGARDVARRLHGQRK